MTVFALISLLQVHLAASPQLVPLPTDVGGSARGAAAVGFDPAAAGRIDGFELQLRQRGGSQQSGLGAFGVFGVAPLFGPLSFDAGYEWGPLPSDGAGRGTVGLAVGLGGPVWAGLSYRSVRPPSQDDTLGVWDLGLFAEPASWLSFSVGVDALNAPAGDGVVLSRAGRLGVAVRPWAASPWLTLAADTRFTGIYDGPWRFFDNRALLDIAPVEGVHVMVSYGYPSQELWASVGFELFGAGLWGGMRTYEGGGGSGGANDVALALQLRARPAESIARPRGRIVEVPLAGTLQDDGGPFNPGKMIGTAALKLDALADDAEVDTVILPIGPLRTGLGTIDELRAAMHRLRQAGKHVIAELRAGDDKTFMAAAAAERVVIDPLATLNLDGFSVTLHYLAAALAKIGVRFDAVGIGKYKTGPDPLTRDAPRGEELQVQHELLDQAQSSLAAVLQEERKLTPAQVAQVLEQGMWTARDALRVGLVDDLTTSDDPNVVPTRRETHESYEATRNPSRAWGRLPTVAVVPVVGTIVAVSADNPLPGAAADAHVIVEQLEQAAADSHVVGVVLRVDSPGGDVYASELIWRAVKRLAAAKPVVVSMADVAASGGYYVAAPAHVILAEPNTVTGSIGIFALKPDFEGLLSMVGVRSETLKTAEHADWDSFEHPLRDADRQRAERTLESYYSAFVARVASGRHLSDARVRELAEGRVYTGARAKDLGLVDAFGGLADAIRLVRTQAGVAENAEIAIDIPDKHLGLPALMQRLSLVSAPWETMLASVAQHLQAWDGRPMALMPLLYEVEP